MFAAGGRSALVGAEVGLALDVARLPVGHVQVVEAGPQGELARGAGRPAAVDGPGGRPQAVVVLVGVDEARVLTLSPIRVWWLQL